MLKFGWVLREIRQAYSFLSFRHRITHTKTESLSSRTFLENPIGIYRGRPYCPNPNCRHFILRKCFSLSRIIPLLLTIHGFLAFFFVLIPIQRGTFFVGRGPNILIRLDALRRQETFVQNSLCRTSIKNTCGPSSNFRAIKVYWG